jgi:hypothetical protein
MTLQINKLLLFCSYDLPLCYDSHTETNPGYSSICTLGDVDDCIVLYKKPPTSQRLLALSLIEYLQYRPPTHSLSLFIYHFPINASKQHPAKVLPCAIDTSIATATTIGSPEPQSNPPTHPPPTYPTYLPPLLTKNPAWNLILLHGSIQCSVARPIDISIATATTIGSPEPPPPSSSLNQISCMEFILSSVSLASHILQGTMG